MLQPIGDRVIVKVKEEEEKTVGGIVLASNAILQGLAAPVNDLSRGCSEQDIYDLAIVTAAQALAKDEN